MSIFRASALSTILTLTCLSAPTFAQEGANWAQTFVTGRVAARNLQAVPPVQRLARMTAIRRSVEPRIVGGTGATANQNPFQVALLLRNDPSAVTGQFCGGTLVSETQVVTAAHCSDFINAREVSVLGGTRNLGSGGTRVNVNRIVLHPSWNATTFDNDVAVWELSSPIRGVPHAKLATSDGATGTNMLVTGWGALSEGGSSPTTLQALTVPMVTRANCNDANSYDGRITGNMICAGFDAGTRDSCQGDSGGPLTRGNGNDTLTGIVSWGFGCARPNLFGVYTRVSASGVRGFLEDTLDLAVPEDCIGFNAAGLRVQADGSRFLLTDGRSRMRVFPNRAEADRTLAILRHYGADRTCFVGRPDPSFSYVQAGSSAPTGAMAGEDCLRHNMANLSILTEGSRITVTDGRSRMLTFPSRSEAQATIDILQGKGATHLCYVGRPGASFTYMRR